MPIRNGADIARSSFAGRQLRKIKFDPLHRTRVAVRGTAVIEPPRPRATDRSVGIQQLFEAGSMTFEVTKLGTKADRPIRKKVLIVEDNDLNMKLFNDLLVAHGYGTLQTKDGVEALTLARRHRPDLILMDIQLPEVSGLQVTQWLKEDDELRMIPIIAVTAFAMKGDEERIRDGGCEAYIAKPISVASFMRTVERFLA
jgi:two-component system cell cycle response regulator DivK